MIPVTKPFLPPKEIYDKLLTQVWQRNWLTNNGPLVNKLELKLKKHLNVEHLLFTGNGTIALQIAIKALNLNGEIITTPFSYVATTSSIMWERCKPIFADIEPLRLTINPNNIEELITEKTSAILATHVFGIPCHIEEIEEIAKKHGLRVIYDAAHVFGTKYKGSSLLNYGDISTLSTHATKLYHTVEGGAIVTQNPELLKKMTYLRNFGHSGLEEFSGIGINGKNSEFHAAMGLSNLPYIDKIILKRKSDCNYYDKWLSNCNIVRPKIPANTEYNYAYYPVLFENDTITKKIVEELAKREIFARRYFYPSLSSLDYVENQNTPVCDNVASRILCLPLYYSLTNEEIDLIARIIIRTLKYNK